MLLKLGERGILVSYLASKNILISAIIGLLGAALECEHEGNIPVKKKDIIKRLNDIEKNISN